MTRAQCACTFTWHVHSVPVSPYRARIIQSLGDFPSTQKLDQNWIKSNSTYNLSWYEAITIITNVTLNVQKNVDNSKCTIMDDSELSRCDSNHPESTVCIISLMHLINTNQECYIAGDTRIQESNCVEADINQRRRSCVMLNDHKTVAN